MITIILRILLLVWSSTRPCAAFNIDTAAPLIKRGPSKSQFGYSVAQHFVGKTPMLLIGAPRANGTQPGTVQSGIVYKCSALGGSGGCADALVEYKTYDGLDITTRGYELEPNETMILGKRFHPEGKNNQMLGAALSSTGVGSAVACAPLARFFDEAHIEGVCYELNNDLTLNTFSSECNLDRRERHNTYGACLQGTSALVSHKYDLNIYGVPGARRWLGGVFASTQNGMIRRRSYAINDELPNELEAFLGSYDYAGYSVASGKFGFEHETPGADGALTVVTGAPRYNNTGCVVLLQFDPRFDQLTSTDYLVMLPDEFVLKGPQQLACSFGYSLLAIDINNDGFDDLVVGAPFYYEHAHADGITEQKGGAIYIYFSTGRQIGTESASVFDEPIVLYGPPNSQFGTSVSAIGDVNRDGYNDFVIGAPYENSGQGAIYLYHGSANRESFDNTSAQVIHAKELNDEQLKTFGWSLSGGQDFDGNGYSDLIVGAFESDRAILLRSRPIIHVSTSIDNQTKNLSVDKEQPCSIASWPQTCFDINTEVRVKREADNTVNYDSDVFQCKLEVLPINTGVALRAVFGNGNETSITWPCGRNADQTASTRKSTVYLPQTNRDWLRSLKFRFSVDLVNKDQPRVAADGRQLPSLDRHPVLDAKGRRTEFTVPFNKKCGKDNTCEADLKMTCSIGGANVTRDAASDTYIKHVGADDTLLLQVSIKNPGERAYEAMLHLKYDHEELDRPRVLNVEGGRITDVGGPEDGLISYNFGNPFVQDGQLKFELAFKLARGKSQGIGRPLEFQVLANSTSVELNPSDNNCSTKVRVIKQAEVSVYGNSEPEIVLYGGRMVGASAMSHEEDVGPTVIHRYTIENAGPWSVNNVTVRIEWPLEVQSPFTHGKYALYLLEIPIIRSVRPGREAEVRTCRMDLANERVNPLKLKKSIDGPPSTAVKVISDEELTTQFDWLDARKSRSSHVLAKTRFEEKTGEISDIVVVSCQSQPGYTPPKSAKCFPILCDFNVIDVGVSATIELRARLWNATFVEDYRDVDYVRVESTAAILIDPAQGVQENNTDDNFARTATRAQPDLPQIRERASVPYWVYILAAVIGLLILALIMLCLYKCGFFKRTRRNEANLYKAEYYEAHEWQQSSH